MTAASTGREAFFAGRLGGGELLISLPASDPWSRLHDAFIAQGYGDYWGKTIEEREAQGDQMEFWAVPHTAPPGATGLHTSLLVIVQPGTVTLGSADVSGRVAYRPLYGQPDMFIPPCGRLDQEIGDCFARGIARQLTRDEAIQASLVLPI